MKKQRKELVDRALLICDVQCHYAKIRHTLALVSQVHMLETNITF